MLQTILSSLPGALAVVDRSGTIAATNAAWVAAVEGGDSPIAEAAVGVNYLAALAREAAAGETRARRIRAGLEAVLRGKSARFACDYEAPSSEEPRTLRIIAMPLDRTEGGVLVARVDVTRRRRTEFEARRSGAEVTHMGRIAIAGELAASLAHDVSQPLSAIMHNANAASRLLSRAEPPVEEIQTILSDIIADDRRAGEMIAQVRALSMKTDFECTVVDAGVVARDAASLLASDALIRQITLSVDADPMCEPIRGDRVQLQQLLLILALNALEAVAGRPPASRRVVMRTSMHRRHLVEISVRDWGPGIPPNALERIFDPFFTTKADGLGIGLAIARTIVHRHGGRLVVENNIEGGATFRAILPVSSGRP